MKLALAAGRGRGKQRTRRGTGQAGFTLVEVLVAVVVMGVGLIGLAAVFPLGARVGVTERMTTQAVDLATQKMEQLRVESYHGTALTAGWHPSSSGEPVGPGNRFTRRYLVTALTGSMSDFKHVEVQVTWAASPPDTIRLVTYLHP